MASIGSDSFASFPLPLPLIVFCSPVALADPSNRMLNSHVDRGRLGFDLRGNAAGASLLGKVLALALRCDIRVLKSVIFGQFDLRNGRRVVLPTPLLSSGWKMGNEICQVGNGDEEFLCFHSPMAITLYTAPPTKYCFSEDS